MKKKKKSFSVKPVFLFAVAGLLIQYRGKYKSGTDLLQ